MSLSLVFLFIFVMGFSKFLLLSDARLYIKNSSIDGSLISVLISFKLNSEAYNSKDILGRKPMMSVRDITLIIDMSESLENPFLRLARKEFVSDWYSFTPASSERNRENCSSSISFNVVFSFILGWFLQQTNTVSTVLNGVHIIERLTIGDVVMTTSALR